MSRYSALICLVGVMTFAMGALAETDIIEKKEAAALKQDSKFFSDLVAQFATPADGSNAEKLWFPTIRHLLNSIERTRRDIIQERFGRSEPKWEIWSLIYRAHPRAYKAINDDLMKLTKALSFVGDKGVNVTNEIEKLLKERMTQVAKH